MPDMSDDYYISKLKRSGVPEHIIAARLSISVDEVRRKWANLLKIQEAMPKTGVAELWGVVTVAGEQLALLSQSLWMLSNGIGNMARPDQLEEVIKSCPLGTDLAVHLLSHFVIINPFQIPDAQELAKLVERAKASESKGPSGEVEHPSVQRGD